MKKTQNKSLAKVYHFDLYGKREEKYNFLKDNSVDSIDWKELENKEPYFFFVPKDFTAGKKYNNGFIINDLMNIYVSGIETVRDKITIHFERNELESVLVDFQKLTDTKIAEKYNTKDARDWKIQRAKNDIRENIKNKSYFRKIAYRPLDNREIFYSGKQNGFVCNGRYNVMKHLLNNNLGLLITNKNRQLSLGYFFVTKNIADRHYLDSAADSMQVFPLYLYNDKKAEDIFTEKDRKPNLNTEIVEQIANKLGLEFVPEKDLTGFQNLSGLAKNFAPIDILDYIYAVLHSPTYREKYKEFLKIDFPRVPYPKNKETFWQLIKLGGELRQIHLLESTKVEEYITGYPVDGDNKITTKISKKDWEITGTISNFQGFENLENLECGRIWINETQYFDNIPLVAWEFYIGGYQPAQKWLKDRKGRTLNFDDILHYQKIIVALSETDRLMKEIDKIEIE